MTVPLILLAIPSVLLGIVLTWRPAASARRHGLLSGWLEPVFAGVRGVPRTRAGERSSWPASTAP